MNWILPAIMDDYDVVIIPKTRFRSAGVSIPRWLASDPRMDHHLCEFVVNLCMVCYPRIYGFAGTKDFANQLGRREDSIPPLIRWVEELGVFRRVRIRPKPLWVMNAQAFSDARLNEGWMPNETLLADINKHNHIRTTLSRRNPNYIMNGALHPDIAQAMGDYGTPMSSLDSIRIEALRPFGDRLRYPKFPQYIKPPRKLYRKSFADKIGARDLSGARHLAIYILHEAKGLRHKELIINELAEQFNVNRETISNWLMQIERSKCMSVQYISGQKEGLTYAKGPSGNLSAKLGLGTSRLVGIQITITDNTIINSGPGLVSSKYKNVTLHDEARRSREVIERMRAANTAEAGGDR